MVPPASAEFASRVGDVQFVTSESQVNCLLQKYGENKMKCFTGQLQLLLDEVRP